MFTLTPHSLSRIQERTGIDPARINEYMDKAVDIPFQLGMGRAVKMFWSVEDSRAYLAYYNVKTSEIVTIYEAYRFVNGEFIGKSATFKDASGVYHIDKTYRVLRSDVNYCLITAGLEPKEEFQKSMRVKKSGAEERTVAYELMATFEYHEKPVVRKVFKKISVLEWDINLPYDGLTQDLANYISEKRLSLDGLINVNVVLREPKRSNVPAGIPLLECDIDKFALQDCVNGVDNDEEGLFFDLSDTSFLGVDTPAVTNSIEDLNDFRAIKMLQEQKIKDY